MSSIADDFSVGIFAAQHYDDEWDFDTLINRRCVRVIGKDPVTKQWVEANGTNGTSETYGFEQGLAVFAPSHAPDPDDNTRNVALWGSAWAGFAGHPSTSTISALPPPSDPEINSPFSVYPSHSQGTNGGWLDDTGLDPQAAVSFDGQDIAGGMPGVIVPLSGATSQQLAFVPAGNALICDWFGGPKGSKYSARIWDVTPSGDRDVKTHAPIHSFWRIYRRPVSGSISFGSASSIVPSAGTGTQSGPKSKIGLQGGKASTIFGPGGPADHDEAIAWLLSPSVDGNAGRGIVADVGARGSPPASTTKTPTGANNKSTSRGPTGGNAQAYNALLAQQNPIAAGVYVPPLTLATTLTGLQSQLATNGQQLSQAVNMGASGASAIAQLTAQKNQIIGAMALLWNPGSGNTSSAPTGGVVQSVLASLCKAAFGIIDVGDAGNDPHLLATTPDGESINQSHLNILAAWKGDGFDCPPATDGAWQDVTSGGPLLAQTFFRTDMSRQHPTASGPRPGLRSWQTPVPMDYPPPPPPPPPPDYPSYTTTNPTADQFVSLPGTYADDPKTQTPGGGSQTTGGATLQITNGGTLSNVVYQPPTVLLTFAGGGEAGDEDSPVTTGINNAYPTPTTGSLPPPDSRPFGTNFFSAPAVESTLNFSPSSGPAGPSTASRAALAVQTAQQRSFMRMPNELALPALLARPQQLTALGVPDLRGLTDTYLGAVPGGFAAYEAPPVAGVLSAVADQSGGPNGFHLHEPPTAARYRGGVAAGGGWALHPANVDIQDVISGKTLPALLPSVYLHLATTAAVLSWGDPNRSALPANGFAAYRNFSTGVKQFKIDDMNASGTVNKNALLLDTTAGTASVYANPGFTNGYTTGLLDVMPTLAQGQMYWATDTCSLYMGC